jgi:hypothetical protein
MFYGGSLLSHLTPEDAAVRGFIALPRINRNFAVVIDSDRKSARKQPNATKRRVRDGIRAASDDAVAWITKGYTIENYLPPDALQAAVGIAHPSSSCTWQGDPYVNPLGAGFLTGRTAVDKSAVAQEVVRLEVASDTLPRLDLEARLDELVALIHRANDLR